MAVQLPDFSTLGVTNPQPATAQPVYPQSSPAAAGEAALGQGIEKAGGTIEDVAAYSQMARNRMDRAMADADFTTRYIPLVEKIRTETDPAKLDELTAQLRDLPEISSQAIGDAAARELWTRQSEKHAAQGLGEAQIRQTHVYNDRYKAGVIGQADSLSRTGAVATDPAAFALAQDNITHLMKSGQESGALTAVEAEQYSRAATKQLVDGRARFLANNGDPDGARAFLAQHTADLDAITLQSLEAHIETKGDQTIALRAVNSALGHSPGAAPDQVDNWEVRNNNFGGMRKVGVPAAGPNAGGFQAFDTPEAGVAAISHQLDRYASGATTGQPLNTLRGIVSTWAPPSENDTPALIARASQVTGFAPDQQIDVSDPAVKAKLIEATIRNEQGGKLPVDPDVISKVAGAPLPQTAVPMTRGQQTLATLPDYMTARASIQNNPSLNDRQRKLALDGLTSQFHQETALYNALDTNAKRDLSDRQTANGADLLSRGIKGEMIDPSQLSDWVRTQQITPEALRAYQAETARQGKGSDDLSTFNDLDRRARAGEDVSQDIQQAVEFGKLRGVTALQLQRANDARKQRDGDQVEKANFSTLRTIAGMDAQEHPMVDLGREAQQAQVALWGQAQQEWNRRVLIGREDSSAVLADMKDRYSHPVEDVNALPRPRMGGIAKPDDVAAVAQKTQAARDAGQLSDQQFREEQALIVRYKGILDAQQQRKDAAAGAKGAAPTGAARGRVEMQ